MKVSFAKYAQPASGALVLGVFENRRLTSIGMEIDGKTNGLLTRAIATGRFEGKKDQSLLLLAPAGLELSHVLLVGLGQASDRDDNYMQAIGGTAVGLLQNSGVDTLGIVIDEVETPDLSNAHLAAHLAFGARLRSYRFDKYFTQEKKSDKPSLRKIVVYSGDPSKTKSVYQPLEAVAEGVLFTRDLVSEPANVLYPATLAEQAKSLEKLGIEVEILGEKQMHKLGMGALLGVGQGSERESQLVVMHWNGGKTDVRPVAFVGKGVTFDTGGISIKPAAGMEDMKWDMGGAGTVIGLMKALAGRKARVNAVGVIGLVENMPSGMAQRPGDVVTSLSGQTIEVINTDAEGRLVLADALWYTQDRFKPQFMINLATLTGAIIIALGSEYAGMFSNNDALAEALTRAGTAVGEKLWRLPLDESYDKLLKSDIADMRNIATVAREAGSIVGAQFLQRFVNKVPWAHLDIAGTAWSKADTSVTPKGATAFGVRLLDRLVSDRYEEKGGKK